MAHQMAHNLELQGGTYHVRTSSPVDVQKAFGGRCVLSQTLMTGVHQEALDRRLPILAAWKAQIKIAREGKPLPEGWQDNLVSGLLELDSLKRNRKLDIIGEPTAHWPSANQKSKRLRLGIQGLSHYLKESSNMNGTTV